jgi:hypothetical protein
MDKSAYVKKEFEDNIDNNLLHSSTLMGISSVAQHKRSKAISLSAQSLLVVVAKVTIINILLAVRRRIVILLMKIVIIVALYAFLRTFCTDLENSKVFIVLVLEALLTETVYNCIIRFTNASKVLATVFAFAICALIIVPLFSVLKQVCTEANGSTPEPTPSGPIGVIAIDEINPPPPSSLAPPIYADLKVAQFQAFTGDLQQLYSSHAHCYAQALPTQVQILRIDEFDYEQAERYIMVAQTENGAWVLLETDAPGVVMWFEQTLTLPEPRCQVWVRTHYVQPDPSVPDWSTRLPVQACPQEACS